MSRKTIYSCDFCDDKIGPKKQFYRGLTVANIRIISTSGAECCLEDLCGPCTEKLCGLITNKKVNSLKE